MRPGLTCFRSTSSLQFGGTIVRLFGIGDTGWVRPRLRSEIDLERTGRVYAGVLRELWHTVDGAILQ
jgi:hypothetical protein